MIFRCVVKTCNAAFTTKQCLQFHYKKVHNFNEEVMPKIERSVDYTFEAYSGVEDQDERRHEDDDVMNLQQTDSTNATLDEESDMDDASKGAIFSPFFLLFIYLSFFLLVLFSSLSILLVLLFSRPFELSDYLILVFKASYRHEHFNEQHAIQRAERRTK